MQIRVQEFDSPTRLHLKSSTDMIYDERGTACMNTVFLFSSQISVADQANGCLDMPEISPGGWSACLGLCSAHAPDHRNSRSKSRRRWR
ncbi:hypothetical protein RV134_350162 [Roseovarius sp. EC-HK134]|nr:hypothetical protein RV420_400442 [Roseovarius sp. EC-SD190]VVT28537.1 hypothetical protein RV134_350162 [Roseovarius sp. EC-HK134]